MEKLRKVKKNLRTKLAKCRSSKIQVKNMRLRFFFQNQFYELNRSNLEKKLFEHFFTTGAYLKPQTWYFMYVVYTNFR
jgi:hypothetical protein